MSVPRTNLKHVAEELGVSTSSVSRAIRNLPGVNPQTRAAVLRTARRMNYHADPHARSLRTGKTNLIGLASAPTVDSTPHDEYLARLEQHARASDKTLIHITYEWDEMDKIESFAIQTGLEGILYFAHGQKQHIESMYESLRRRRVAMVQLDGPASQTIDCVTYDRGHSTDILLDHLCSLGCRTIALVAPERVAEGHGASGKYTDIDIKLQQRSMTRRQTIIVPPGQVHGPDAFEASRNAVDAHITERGVDFDAMMCANDELAVGAMRALYDNGIDVPDQVKVTGHDNREWALYTNPSLTTVRRPLAQMADIAWNTLIEHLQGQPAQPVYTAEKTTGPVGTHIHEPAKLDHAAGQHGWTPDRVRGHGKYRSAVKRSHRPRDPMCVRVLPTLIVRESTCAQPTT